MANWLRRMFLAWIDRHDPAAVMQARPTPLGWYDFDAAIRGKRNAARRKAQKFKADVGTPARRRSDRATEPAIRRVK